MSVAIITGSGTYSLPGFEHAQAQPVQTPYGAVEVSRGDFAGAEVLHVSRHGAGHVRLSNQVTHRADIWALRELGATAVIGCTACGGVDPSLALGSLVVFDDLHFISNRLPDGSLCTFFQEPGDPRRGHWILHGGPFSDGVRDALLAGAAEAGHAARDGGVYGHVDGPRFNTPTEIAQLASCGVTAVSQTGGPETVLCGELELPFALIGFVTDYANEVFPGEPTPISTLGELMASSTAVFAAVLGGAVGRLTAEPPAPAGSMFRFSSGSVASPRVVLMPASGGRPQSLERELTARARRWADEIAPDAVVLATTGVGEAVTELFAGGGGPVLVLWPELAHWRPDHAAGALDDLSDGCQFSVGPMFDGGFYLVAFARPVPGLLELPDGAWQTPDPIGLAVDAARRSGQAIGLLRTERGLRTPADVKALLADPLVDDELRRLLS